MSKIIGVVMVGVLLIGGWFLWKNTKTAEAPGDNAMETPIPPQISDTVESETQGIVASIKDAMGLGKKMQCTYTSKTEKGESFQSTVIVDGATFKTVSNVGDMTVYGLFDGKDQYTWTSQSKEGYKMSKVCMEELQSLAPSQESEDISRPKIDDLEKQFDVAQNVNCIPATSADFGLPKEVAFTDQCVMMKQSLEMMKQFQGKLPTGVTIPGIPSGN